MKITVAECAELLEGSPGWVRSLTSRGIIGDSWGNGKNRKTYQIVPSKLANFMEISESELNRRLEKIRYYFIEAEEDGKPTGEILKVPKSCKLTQDERRRIERNMSETDREIAKLRSEMWELAKEAR